MARAEQLITENLDLWSSAVKAKTSAGRGSSKKLELYGIAKFRELILDLAVRGMLIPQENTDERSSILLKQASDERSRLERDRTIKAVRIKPIEADEEPYKIPESWCWARFPQLCHYSPGKTPSTKNPSFWASGEDTLAIPWVSISDMLHSGSISTTNKKVSTLAKDEVFKREAVKAGSILMSFKLTVGKISRISVDAYHNEAIISITPFSGILDEYIFKFLPKRALEGNTKSAIMGNTLNASSLAQLLIPLPPLAEQHRIVAKVDELMALCDQLEQEQDNNLKTHETLVSTLLNALTSAAADASQFADAWQRIQDNFDILFTTESSVDQLKQTILQLAVMGKLVPQNSEDESGRTLLSRILDLRHKNWGMNKKIKPPYSVNASDFPNVPSGWTWTSVDQIGLVIGGLTKNTKRNSLQNQMPYLRVANVYADKLNLNEIKSIGVTDSELDKVLLKKGDLLIVEGNGSRDQIGRLAIWDGSIDPCVHQNHLIKVRLIEPLIGRYTVMWMLSASGRNYIERVAVSSTGLYTLSVGKVSKLPIPLPPLSEQHRIVAKFDELMALCDSLKARLTAAQDTQLKLADSIAEQAIHSPT